MHRSIPAFLTAVVLLVSSSIAVAQMNPFGLSGFTLDQGDIDIITKAVEPFYEEPPPAAGTSVTWENDASGSRGTATLMKVYEINDMPCRRIRHDIRVKNVSTLFTFTVDRCQVADGSWKAL